MASPRGTDRGRHVARKWLIYRAGLGGIVADSIKLPGHRGTHYILRASTALESLTRVHDELPE